MTYLAKVRKCDLSKLAYELGEVVPPESRIVDLKRLILNSQSYEEEFAKQLLETLIEEREQTERAERERMEQTAQTEQAERIERERIEDRKRIEDRERIERKEQMVMEFELEKLRIQTTRGNNDTSRSTSNDTHYEIRKLMPKYESKDNDLSFYLILFERQAKRLGLDEDQWAFSLLGLLPYEMTQLIARETEEQSGDYRFVKRLLLKRYKLSPEQFRQKFEKHERSQKGSWRDFAFELRGYFNEWIEGMNVENFDALKDLSVTNQLKKKVPNVLRNHLIDDWTKLNNPDELADKLDEYENVRTEMGPPHWNAKHLIPPSFQQKSARFLNQSEVKETKQGTNVSGQDAARNEISETYPNTLRRMVNRAIRNDKGEPKCFNCNQFGHIARDCPAPRTTLTCRGCGQTGHKERNCTRPKEGLKVANLEVEGLETVPPDVYLKDVKIDNKETVKAMIDTGSSSCLMRESVARRISVDIEPDSTSLYGIGNQTAPAARTVGKTTVDLEIDGIVGREITVFIVNDDAQPYDLLIGRTWTDLPYVSFARIGKNLHIGYSSEFPFANLQEEIKSRRIELRATETVQLESDSINFTSAITDEVKDGYVLFTGVDDACVDSLLEVVDGKTTVPIISAGKGKLRVRKNQCVGRVELLNLDDIVVNLDVAEDSFQTKNEEKREGQDQMKRRRPILPEDINVNHSLTSKERQEILDVVNEYRDCFALGMEELGCTDVTKMDIKEVDGSKPVCLRPYKTTASEREAIREIVREWKDNGIVTETRSPYASPVLLVRKKTGDHRLVVDYRRLNIQTVKDKFPLPRIDDLLEGLRNAKFFTTLDLAHGYLQIPLTDKAKLKTAFITPDDTGQFERMIFGLANAPAEFQRLMHTVLGPLLNKKAFCYLDDVIIPAKDWREMIERLREVLERIRSAKLTLKPSKCEFGRREVEFLGYVISTGGLKPGPRKIKAIEEFPEPKNVHDIRRFLGLTNFFRRFVKDFARKAEPLSRLTKKGSQFEWKEEQRRSFGGLRKDLVEYPVLAHYNPELKTEVHCDASAEGLAGMVLQMDEDCKWRLVYCVSKKTTEAEKMYHSSKLELMAIVWTLDRLRQFLVGIKFTVVTDCQALVYMNAKKTTNPQIARWYNLIQEYDFEIRHKPGEKMAHVDGMSRAPVDDPRDTMEEIVEKNLEVCLTITPEEQILMIQHSDPELRDLIQIFRKDPCDKTVGEQNRINDYSYRRKSGRGARSRRYPPTQPTTFLQRKVQSRTIEIQEWPNSSVTQEQPTNQRTTKGPNPKALNCTQREASVHNWFVDSGATSHMAYDESFFTELNREQTQNVVVANGNKLQVKGIGQGEIKVITPQGKTDTLLLTKVLYIPELTDNLLSVSAATSNGCKVTFNRDWCTIERDNTALANGILDNGMYRLHLDDNPQTRTFKANVAKQNHCKNKNCLMLWHDRLGHRNIESIKKIRNENLARGLSLNNCSHSTDCVQCIQGKLTETPFPKKTEYRATETLQLVHSDICGPLPTNSLSGKRYFITFTDDYSRYTKIYLLKGKDEAYEKIKDYVISAHTEFGKNIQTIRTDNGREYVNRQVEDFLNQSGIKHQLTVPYSPAQNGVAERKNRSLMEMTRCMLFDSGLPQSLWAEAVTTANYLHNRIPSKATDKTPFELWTNRKPSLKHLKRFGCKAFAYIPKIKRNNLDSKVIEGIFLGYDDRSKGYRILHDTDNITISRSVKFIEKENGFHHTSTKTTSPQVLSTDLTSSNHIGNAEESQEPGTQSENLEDSETEDYLQPGTSTGTQVVTQRRSTRPTKGIPPIRNDYMLYKTEAQDIQTPTNYSEVLQLPKIQREKWLQAMNEELNSLEKNNVWELTPLPKDKKIIGCKWTYKQKLNSKGEIERYKARLVAKGFNQKFGRDYEETFAPIVKHSTIRAFLAASVYKGMQVIHLDVKTAFLHGDLDKELYMELPEGLHTKQTNEVCKLKKEIYGLKQAGRSWNTKIASTLIKNNFKQSIVDPCLFTKNEENHSIYLILYVDDMLLATDSEIIIQNTVKTLEKEFEIKNLGDPTQFIGIEISRNREGELLLSQKNKIQELVERYNLQEAKPTFTPMESGYPGISDEKLLPNNVQYQQLIGSLLYLSVVSRPDIAAPVCILSSRNQNPRNCDWNAAKRIVRYLKTTKELELRISNQKPPTLKAYSDATWASDNTDRKSLSGNLFLLGSNPISWMTGKQGCVSLSSTEAELISAAEASQELLWLLDLLKDLELEQKAPIYFHQDNQSCLKICSSEKVSSRTKHIATKIHHLKDLQKKTVIKMTYCPTGDMKADILTKPLPRPTFEKLRYNLVILMIDRRIIRHDRPTNPLDYDRLTDPQTYDRMTDPRTYDRMRDPQTYDRLTDPQTNDRLAVPQTYDRMKDHQTYDRMMDPQTNERLTDPETYDRMKEPQTYDRMTDPQICGDRTLLQRTGTKLQNTYGQKNGGPTMPRQARVLRTLHYACAGVIRNFLAAGFFRHLIWHSGGKQQG
ncbi:hypothetical protein LAZ67_1001594 [Cordylochernes scorpioides]|uniref:RNA-directed DNA polymerase n=1 Tax=Cordylochernes scorpioides TaxID=51811 RepID=A0ABY6JVI3_9ARAC|nr:hypothetical protein LAZ67_1001594 [Cordylochernes scorpioides]